MHQTGYENFIHSFIAVNPYQLAHLTEIMLLQFEDMLADLERKEKLPFTQQDIKLVMIRTMQLLYMELGQMKIQEAQHQLEWQKKTTYAVLVGD